MSRIRFAKLTSTRFEEFCFELLRRLDFSNLDWRKGTPRESSPADSGRDIVAHQQREDVDGSRFHDTWFVDCKHYSKAVPPTELQAALSWAEAERPAVLLFIASGFFSNPAKDYLEKYRQNRKPSFRIKMWEYPQLAHAVAGRHSLLRSYGLVVKEKMRSLRQVRKAEEACLDRLWYTKIMGFGGASHTHIRKWEPERRRRVMALERKYGRRNLILRDPYEATLVTGKVSALFWVQGHEWSL